MYNPSIWDSELDFGRRQYIGSILVYNRDSIHMSHLAYMLNRLAHECPEMPEKTPEFHNSRFRRKLTKDIDEMNRNRDFRFIIVSNSDGVRIANKKEAAHMVEMLRKKALRTLAKASILADKANLDCQLSISGEEIKTFLEDENE